MGKRVSMPFRQEFLSSKQTELAARVNVSAMWICRVDVIHVTRRQLLRLQRYVPSCCLNTAG